MSEENLAKMQEYQSILNNIRSHKLKIKDLKDNLDRLERQADIKRNKLIELKLLKDVE